MLRVSAADRELILAGLGYIAMNREHEMATGTLPNARLGFGLSGAFSPGKFDTELMKKVLAIYVHAARSKSTRLYLHSSIEIAACALGVRVAVKGHADGVQVLSVPRIKTASKRLLQRLENLRKCAKRSEVRDFDAESYKEVTGRWREFVQWLRVHYLEFDHTRLRRSRRLAHPPAARMIFDELAAVAQAELIARKERVPARKMLRSYVSMALRYVRRGRTGFDVRRLLHDKVLAGAHLANFISIREEKASRGKR